MTKTGKEITIVGQGRALSWYLWLNFFNIIMKDQKTQPNISVFPSRGSLAPSLESTDLTTCSDQ